jgi:hypothetical protein
MTKELKPISESEIICLIEEQGFDVTDTYGEASEHLAKAICQRFGQPAVPSAKKIEKIINDELDNPSNVRMDWRYQIATAIHNNLLRGAK